jgi:hypothetical protein
MCVSSCLGPEDVSVHSFYYLMNTKAPILEYTGSTYERLITRFFQCENYLISIVNFNNYLISTIQRNTTMAPARIEPELEFKQDLGVPNFNSLPKRYGWETEDKSGYKIKEQLCGTKRPVRVISLGAGVSGINLAYHISKSAENVTLAIYEKNDDVGGTWYENK